MRILTTMLAYGPPENLYKALESFEKTETLDSEKYLFDPGFPQGLQSDYKWAAKRFGFEYRKINNYGLSTNLNQIGRILKIERDDILCWLSPDTVFDCGAHWQSSMLWAFQELPRMNFLGFLTDEVAEVGEVADIDKVRLLKTDKAVHWPMGAFRGDFLRRTGVQQHHKFLGGMESFTMELFRYFFLEAYYLRDFKVKHLESSASYELWKKLSKSGEIDCDFEDFIKTV